MSVVEAIDLRRTYSTTTGSFRRRKVEIEAVRGVSFEIREGELFGLLGPNGAGKTTTIKMLITLLIPTSGTARVLGHDVVGDARCLVGLKGRERERVEGYSRGMRQRLHIARGPLHDPPVLFLDEPTIGVDPVGARELRAMIASLTKGGKTVLLTTHYMFEADSLCDRIAVIANGSLVAQGTPQELKAGVAADSVVEVEVFGIDERSVARVEALDGVTTVTVEELEHKQLLVVHTAPGRELTHVILSALNGTSIGRVSSLL